MGLFDGMFGDEKNFNDRHKYINDFKTVETVNRRGKTVKRAVYTGIWFEPRFKKSALVKIIKSACLSVLLAVLYFNTMLLTHTAGGEIAVMLPLSIGLFPILYLMMGVISLPYGQKPMRRDQYMHSFIRVSRSCAASGTFVLLGFVISFICRLVRGNWAFYKEDFVFLGSCAVIIALALGVIFLLRSIDIVESPNSSYKPASSLPAKP